MHAARADEVAGAVALVMSAGFDALGVIHPLLARFGARAIDERYDATGVRLRLEIAESRVPELAAALRDATRGQAALKPAR